eukprot:1352091-Rhodomonas_salina.1
MCIRDSPKQRTGYLASQRMSAPSTRAQRSRADSEEQRFACTKVCQDQTRVEQEVRALVRHRRRAARTDIGDIGVGAYAISRRRVLDSRYVSVGAYAIDQKTTKKRPGCAMSRARECDVTCRCHVPMSREGNASGKRHSRG